MLHDGCLIVRVTVDLEMRIDSTFALPPVGMELPPVTSGSATNWEASGVGAGCVSSGGRSFLTNLKYTDMVLVVRAPDDSQGSTGEDSSNAGK